MSTKIVSVSVAPGTKIKHNDEQYVHRLMGARCTCGSMTNFLNIKVDHGVLVGEDQQPLLNANDHIAGENVIHFGKCNSDKNPERAFRKDLVGKLIAGPFAILGIGNLVTDVLESMGVLSFKCTPKTDEVWEDTNENNILEGAPAVLMKSCLTCRYGGVIWPLEEVPKSDLENGQDGEEEGETEEIDTVQAETDAILAAALDRINATGAERDQTETEALVNMIAATATNADKAIEVINSFNESEPVWNGVIPWVKPISNQSNGRSHRHTDDDTSANYEHNSSIPILDYLTENGNMIVDYKKLTEFLINNFSADQVGSGAAAAHNIYQILEPGNAPSFADVIQRMEPYGFLSSPYGIVPCGMTYQFLEAGYKVSYEIENVGEKLRDTAASIIGYATQAGTEFITCKPGDAGTLQFFGLPDGLDNVVNTYSELMTRLRERGAFAVMAMTVSGTGKNSN